jgi:hypothetical protein
MISLGGRIMPYQGIWDASPEEMRQAVETGIMPEPDTE